MRERDKTKKIRQNNIGKESKENKLIRIGIIKIWVNEIFCNCNTENRISRTKNGQTKPKF